MEDENEIMEEEISIYEDGFECARAGYGMLMGNPHRVLSRQWHIWREGYSRCRWWLDF